MTRQLLMGIDAGTQSARVVLVDLDGQVHASSSLAYEMSTPRPGWAEEDPEDWLSAAFRCIQEVIKRGEVKPGEVIAIGVDAQMHATIPLGPGGELLSHGVQLWCDKRPADLVERFKKHPHLDRAMRLAGSPPIPAWVGFKIQWLKDNEPDLYRKTWKFLSGEGYLNYHLTGSLNVDWSEASGYFLMDAQTFAWSAELAEYLDLSPDKLPDIYPSTGLVGKVSRDCALNTGLTEGIPVIAGAGDMITMAVAAGLARRQRALDISGTASNLTIYVENPILDPPLMNLHHGMPGWIPFGIVDSGGGTLKWFKDQLCQFEITEADRRGIGVYDILNEKAACIEAGSEGLLFFPYMMGERVLGSPYARGVFFGLTHRTSTGSMVRAIMEGITFELRRTLEIVEKAGNQIVELYTSGGGSRSALWSQIKADIYQKPVITLEASEGTVLGSAILAGVGIGVFKDAQEGADRCLEVKRVYQPNPENFARYDRLYELFKEVHDQLQPSFDKLARIT
jgi:xylulokinase